MAPFRNDLDAADARAEKLQRELQDAEQHAADLRAKQEGVEAPARKKSAKRKKHWFRRKRLLAFPAAVIGVFVGLPAFGNMTAASCGYRAAVLDAVNSCPEAQEALGDDIHFGYVGLACGTTSINDDDVDYDYARWRMPISGSRSSGVYRFNAQDHGQGWGLRSGEVEVDGKRIDLSTCSQTANSSPTPGSKSGSGTKPGGVLSAKCDAGDARACRDLSILYELGNTVEKDPAKAKAYSERACTLGLSSACKAPSTAPKVQP